MRKKKLFLTEVAKYTATRYDTPELTIVLPQRISKYFCWGNKVRVTIERIK